MQDTGEREGKNMKKKTAYKETPDDMKKAIAVSEIIEDFLPSPELLVKKEDTVKVTILLNRSSVEFFKTQAKKTGVPYQTMIKAVLDRYSSHYNR